MPTYRYYLWKLALARGYRIDFVGSKHGAARGAPLKSDFDMDHEGHSGWRADQILAQIATWSTETHPHFVLLDLNAAGESQMADRWVTALSPFRDVFYKKPLPLHPD